MTEAAVFPPYKALTSNGWRKTCVKSLEDKFGWLKHQLELANGNLSALADNEQKLWRWREKAVGEFNRISKIRDEVVKIRAYRKLYVELS